MKVFWREGGGGYSFSVRAKGGHTQTLSSPLRLRFGTSTILCTFTTSTISFH